MTQFHILKTKTICQQLTKSLKNQYYYIDLDLKLQQLHICWRKKKEVQLIC